MNAYTSAGRPRAIAGLEIRTVDDETLVHDPATDRIHVLNGAAAAVLGWCDGTRDAAALAAALRDRFPDASGDVEADVRDVLASFRRLGIVRDIE